MNRLFRTVSPGRVVEAASRYPLLASVPDRARLERLADVPHRASFELADTIGVGLRTVRPGLMQQFLEPRQRVARNASTSVHRGIEA